MESLNAGKNIFNNIVEIYLHILILELKIDKTEITTCEEGTAIFYSKTLNLKDVVNMKNFNYIIIPILHCEHFTIVFINMISKEIYYIDTLGENPNTKNKIYSIILETVKGLEENTDGWKLKDVTHPIQKDSYNCGVHCVQFIEAILKKMI